MNVDVLAQLETLVALDDPNASAEERARRSDDLTRIMAHVQTLDHALVGDDASDLEPPQALRADVPREGLPRHAALRAAPHADETSFMVPRILP